MDTVFERDEIIATINKRIEGFKKGYRQNIALIGNPLMGKTQTLRGIISNINSNDLTAIFIDLKLPSLRQINNSYCNQLLRHFLKTHGVEASDDTNRLLDQAQAFLPKTIAKIKLINQYIERNKQHLAILDMFELTHTFYEESNISILFVLDEFQNLENFGGENIFTEISKKIVVHKNTMYLVASSLKIRAKEILAQSLSLLFGNFELLEMDAYDITKAKYFIDRNLKLNITDKYKKFIIDLTSGHPFYLDHICRELFSQSKRHGQNHISPNVLLEAFANLLFDRWGILNQRFSNFLDRISGDKHREDYVAILTYLTSGSRRVKEIARYLNKKEKIIQQRLFCLYDTGVIAKNGDLLYFTDKIFRFWISFVYNPKHGFDYIGTDALRLNFKNQLLKLIDLFAPTLEQNVIERVLELFKLFNAESIQIERKKIVLSPFKEIELLDTAESGFDAVILAKSATANWIVAIKNIQLSQEDIARFIAYCKNYRKMRAVRKVIITLNALDTNVKLRTLQEKITTWEVSDLNSLFKLYSKPVLFT